MNVESAGAIPSRFPEFRWRPVDRGDFPAIQWMTAAAAEVGRTESASVEEIERVFNILGDQVRSNTLLAEAEDDKIAALALVLILPAEQEHIAMMDGRVDVDYRGRSLGSAILAWMEERVRQAFSEYWGVPPMNEAPWAEVLHRCAPQL